MTVKKYELTDDTMKFQGCTVHRIRALVDIPAIGVSAGDLGGYIESEKNLSHEGNCWVGTDAIVKDNAVVGCLCEWECPRGRGCHCERLYRYE